MENIYQALNNLDLRVVYTDESVNSQVYIGVMDSNCNYYKIVIDYIANDVQVYVAAIDEDFTNETMARVDELMRDIEADVKAAAFPVETQADWVKLMEDLAANLTKAYEEYAASEQDNGNDCCCDDCDNEDCDDCKYDDDGEFDMDDVSLPKLAAYIEEITEGRIQKIDYNCGEYEIVVSPHYGDSAYKIVITTDHYGDPDVDTTIDVVEQGVGVAVLSEIIDELYVINENVRRLLMNGSLNA